MSSFEVATIVAVVTAIASACVVVIDRVARVIKEQHVKRLKCCCMDAKMSDDPSTPGREPKENSI